jgi:hypothetical protein
MITVATLWSCSDGDRVTPPSGGKGDAGAPGATAEGGAAGTESGAGGLAVDAAGANSEPSAAGAPEPDSAGGASAGASPDANGDAGAGAGLSAGGGGGNAGAATGGTAPDAGEALSFCPRLGGPELSAFNVTRAYDHAVYNDCRVTWVTDLYLKTGDRDTFLNDLLSWCLRFWGCQTPAVDDFALIYQTAPLTSADAAALIDDYMSVATTELTLSTGEIAQMRAALGRLSRQTVAQDSSDYSHSACGGASGTAGGGSAGTGGSHP